MAWNPQVTHSYALSHSGLFLCSNDMFVAGALDAREFLFHPNLIDNFLDVEAGVISENGEKSGLMIVTEIEKNIHYLFKKYKEH